MSEERDDAAIVRDTAQDAEPLTAQQQADGRLIRQVADGNWPKGTAGFEDLCGAICRWIGSPVPGIPQDTELRRLWIADREARATARKAARELYDAMWKNDHEVPHERKSLP